MRIVLLAAAFSGLSSPVLADFSITFTWGDIPLCTSGYPNRVPNPRFVVKDLPAGTTSIQFRLTDLDVPGYDHGGGKVKMGTDSVIEPGAFKYKSPCPPSGSHTYEWKATAKAGGKTLGTATARRRYPE